MLNDMLTFPPIVQKNPSQYVLQRCLRRVRKQTELRYVPSQLPFLTFQPAFKSSNDYSKPKTDRELNA